MAVAIARAETPEDLDAVRGLIREFFDWAMSQLSETDNPPAFAGLDAELAGLPGRFGPPTGCLLLARLDGAPAGCVAFFGQDATTMEVKRMFVRPEARGRGSAKGWSPRFWPRRRRRAIHAVSCPPTTSCAPPRLSTAARASARWSVRSCLPLPCPI